MRGGPARRSRDSVAPSDIIQSDFRALDSEEQLRTTWDVERLILIQSVQGHAHEGHCKFNGIRYSNTTIDDISRALRLDPTWVRCERQRLIDEIAEYVERVLEDENNDTLTNEDGAGLLGSSMFGRLTVHGKDVLRGLYLGGLRDDPEVRFEMESRYDITIGGGKCYLVNTRVMERMGLDGDILAHGAHEDMLDYYRGIGLIVGEEGRDGKGVEYMYIRHRRGHGASDDTAIVAAGLLHGLGVAVGVFLADAIDTLEKCVQVFSDQDNRLAQRIASRCPDLRVSSADLRHLAYLAAIPEEAPISVPDSSLRHLMLVDRRVDTTAIESHLMFVEGKRYPRLRIGAEETDNRAFYEYVKDRIRNSPGPL